MSLEMRTPEGNVFIPSMNAEQIPPNAIKMTMDKFGVSEAEAKEFVIAVRKEIEAKQKQTEDEIIKMTQGQA